MKRRDFLKLLSISVAGTALATLPAKRIEEAIVELPAEGEPEPEQPDVAWATVSGCCLATQCSVANDFDPVWYRFDS